MENKKYAKDYTLSELMVAATSREIKDRETIFAGVGLPCLGALTALLTHAPRAIIATEGGCIGPLPKRLLLGIGDNACAENAICTTSLWRLFSDLQRGYFDVGMLGGAQVDKYGNLNSTAIFGKGSYLNPAVRLPGSGGANDIASSAKRTIIMIPLDKRKFVEKVDYITSPGHIDGKMREKLKLRGGGPSAVITDKCIFRFDKNTKEMYLDALFPGVTIDDVLSNMSFEIKVSPNLRTVEPPTEEEVQIIRTLDPKGIYTGDGLSKLTFEDYIQMLEDSYRNIGKLYIIKLGQQAFERCSK
ncbi:MAG: CoA-transferase [Archaeoglobaceae archaeon]